MRSGKSFFNKTLYTHDLKRGWPIWLTYFLVYLFPLVAMVREYMDSDIQRIIEFVNEEIYYMTAMTPITAMIFGVLAAMSLFNYLYSTRSANGLHALPLKREGHFLTHFAAGMSYFLIPNAVLAVLTLVLEACMGSVNVSVILLNFVYMSLIMLFFFSFAVFCAQFAGHIVALPIFYVIWNFFFLVLSQILRYMFSMMLYGFHAFQGMERIATNLTPVVRLMERIDIWNLTSNDAVFWIFIYGAAGAVFTVLALLLYRRRQMETAGDVIAVSQAKPLFSYGVAFFFGSGMAFMTMGIFGFVNDVVFYITLILWGILGYFVAEMLLHKSFRVLKKGCKGAAAFTLVMLVLFVGIRLDFAGFERRIPDPVKIEYVWVSGISTATNDTAGYRHGEFKTAEEIEVITQIHQAILNHRDDGSGYDNGQYIIINYTLKDGSFMTRSYTVPYNQETLSDASHPSYQMLRLINRPDYLRNKFFPASIQMSDFIRGTFNAQNWDKRDYMDEEYGEVVFTAEETQQLYLAVSEDFAAGRIGKQGFHIWQPNNTVYKVFPAENDYVYAVSNQSRYSSPTLNLVHYGFYEEWEYCSTEYSYDGRYGENIKKIADSYETTFVLVDTAVSTIAKLSELTGLTEVEILDIIRASESIYY